MVDKFGTFEYALAAYNAGSNRVDDWLGQGKYRDPQEFVESVPFTETREYGARHLAQRQCVSAALWSAVGPAALRETTRGKVQCGLGSKSRAPEYSKNCIAVKRHAGVKRIYWASTGVLMSTALPTL